MTFNSVRPIFEYSRTWDFKAYKAQQHSVTTLREQMQRIGVWVNELEKMRARQPCGILEASRPNHREGRKGIAGYMLHAGVLFHLVVGSLGTLLIDDYAGNSLALAHKIHRRAVAQYP